MICIDKGHFIVKNNRQNTLFYSDRSETIPGIYAKSYL